ncbi:MAG TPA: VOC family protein [Actinomycetota bacterium]|nr:VOC family protein [Actinomycetota bacterium]
MTRAQELRFAFVFDNHEGALRLFRDVFGLQTMEEFEHEGSRGVILRVPSATLELFDLGYGRHVDDVEVGHPVDSRVRIAVKIDDLDEASAAVVSAGAKPEADKVVTPWGDHNQRFRTGDGLQLTLFQSGE